MSGNTPPDKTDPIALESFTTARWFAGKERTLTRADPVETIAVPDALGAAVELVEVAYADGGHERYALPLRDRSECNGHDPLWPALARAAGVAVDQATGFLAEDLSNTVVVLDGTAVLKLYRRPERGAHPEVEALNALSGSPYAPRLLGSLDHEGATLVVVQELIVGEPVGWEHLISRLASGDPAAGEPAELARVTAILHRTLADALGTSQATLVVPEVALEGDLAVLTSLIESRLEKLAQSDTVQVQRIHGDLHVAQFLRTDSGVVVVDWEGQPDLPLAERGRPRPALCDLGSLRLSLAHAARAAHRRNPQFAWHEWAEAARAQARAAYEALVPGVDPELLHALELEKELAELAYAARWLPEWLYAPTAVLPFILETP